MRKDHYIHPTKDWIPMQKHIKKSYKSVRKKGSDQLNIQIYFLIYLNILILS